MLNILSATVIILEIFFFGAPETGSEVLGLKINKSCFVVNTCRDKLKDEKSGERIEDMEKKTHVAVTKDTTRMTNSNEPLRVDKKVWFPGQRGVMKKPNLPSLHKNF